MHRIDTRGNVDNRFRFPPDGTLPGDMIATKVSDKWLNAVQEEICGVIEAFGGKLGKGQESERQMAGVLQNIKINMDKQITAIRNTLAEEIKSRGTEFTTIWDEMYDEDSLSMNLARKISYLDTRILALEKKIG